MCLASQGQKVTAVSCGAEHSVVATENGQVYAWGWGRYGNVGDGQKVDRCCCTPAGCTVCAHLMNSNFKVP